ncbi:MAG: CPBP family intramembrane metalloprotease [Cyanobacteria bacterium HKST-UBA02]|nr:CPBP family intramembrane metalloprotease [Cyanobacteria bacterium HKST-UBA02]
MLDFILILGCSILALMGHGARKRKWLEWFVRIIIGFFVLLELNMALFGQDFSQPWIGKVTMVMALASLIILVLPMRKLISALFTFLDGITSLRAITGPVRHHMSVINSIIDKKVFIPESIPHMVGLFCFITTFGWFLQVVNPASMDFPSLPFAVPISVETLFSYNGLGLVFVSFCGIGVLVSRNWKECLDRLGWKKPSMAHVGIGIGLIGFSFAYDLIWSLYTHGLTDQDLATKLSAYNSGTFAVSDNFGIAVMMGLATAIFAGVGEETLIRGALQPVVGILPAAILHGVLHAQFSHAPIFIVQVAIWSMCMGIVRRFTNTTTTIIGHAGFNFVTTFLFVFNP